MTIPSDPPPFSAEAVLRAIFESGFSVEIDPRHGRTFDAEIRAIHLKALQQLGRAREHLLALDRNCQPPAQDEFLAAIERFLRLSKMKAYRFGMVVLGDPSFVYTLRRGRNPNLSTVAKVEKFIREYEPDAAPTEPERQAS